MCIELKWFLNKIKSYINLHFRYEVIQDIKTYFPSLIIHYSREDVLHSQNLKLHSIFSEQVVLDFSSIHDIKLDRLILSNRA